MRNLVNTTIAKIMELVIMVLILIIVIAKLFGKEKHVIQLKQNLVSSWSQKARMDLNKKSIPRKKTPGQRSRKSMF